MAIDTKVETIKTSGWWAEPSPTTPRVSTASRRRRLIPSVVAASALALVASALASATGSAQGTTGTGQELATLSSTQTAMSSPSERSSKVEVVPATRPITGTRTVLPVIGAAIGQGGTRWLDVLLPGRPNGHTGWIRQAGTTASSTTWQIVIDTTTRRATAYEAGRAMRTFKVVVGKPSTPTPHGRFFVEEDVQLPADAVGAPFALALSARSDVLQEFEGGPGQIALHGLANVGGTLGTAVSHGCIRLDAASMRWLVARIGAGVPVTISG